MKYEVILFDLWGTLVDFRLPELEALAKKARREIGDERWEIVRQHFNAWHRKDIDHKGFMQQLLSEVNLNNNEAELVEAWIAYGGFKLFPETIEVLSWLKENNFKLGLVSNSPQSTMQHFKDFGLDTFFDELSFSFELGFMKPEKEIFQDALRKLEIKPSQALMIGDSLDKDVEAAEAVGIDGLLIDRDDTYDYEKKILNLLELKDLL
ncbi:HAD-IA family hydrolase [Patescibacteria group bacterium]|nr:HAD-IA family hydrolase [Patescibacteria group bacterium]